MPPPLSPSSPRLSVVYARQEAEKASASFDSNQDMFETLINPKSFTQVGGTLSFRGFFACRLVCGSCRVWSGQSGLGAGVWPSAASVSLSVVSSEPCTFFSVDVSCAKKVTGLVMLHEEGLRKE